MWAENFSAAGVSGVVDLVRMPNVRSGCGISSGNTWMRFSSRMENTTLWGRIASAEVLDT